MGMQLYRYERPPILQERQRGDPKLGPGIVSPFCYLCILLWRWKVALLAGLAVALVLFYFQTHLITMTKIGGLRLLANRSSPTLMIDPLAEIQMRFSNYNETYRFHRPAPDVCSGVKVLVIVISGPGNFTSRREIRETWMYDEINPQGYLTLFLVGHSTDEKVNKQVKEERREYSDIILFDSPEQYLRLSIKSHAAYSWQQMFCPNASYLVKTDDDTVVNLQRLDYHINKRFDRMRNDTPKSFFCGYRSRGTPYRNPRAHSYVSMKMYPYNTYPPYCHGCTYMASTDAVKAVLKAAPNTTYLHFEDVLLTGLAVKTSGDINFHDYVGIGEDPPKMSSIGCDEEGEPLIISRCSIAPANLKEQYERIKSKVC